MTHKEILGMALMATSVFTVGGCSEGSRRNYDAAGAHVINAAKETGHAISEDANKAGHTVSDSVDGSARSNDDLSDKVQDALLKSTEIHARDISVSTSGNLVTIRGEVGSEVENQQAEHIARGVLGSKYTVDDQ